MNITGPTLILLDTGPLGLVTQRPGHAGGDACRAWYRSLAAVGCRFFVPEIADYEVRLEMLRAANANAIDRLNAFHAADRDRYRSLTTVEVREAARLWAYVRNAGRPGAAPEALDGDVLIAAQVRLLDHGSFGYSQALLATVNEKHFAGLCDACLWSDIQPRATLESRCPKGIGERG